MNADDFARLCHAEKEWLLNTYFDPGVETAVGAQIREMQIDGSDFTKLRALIDGVLTDTFYTLLLALDGAASLGGEQHPYDLRDESGEQITGDGELEAAAYQRFQES